MLHFVGFKGDEYLSALKVWGLPDFYHRWNDGRFRTEFFPEIGDVAIYANGADVPRKSVYSFNDSEVF